jgi:hypothetical protein
VSYEIPSSTTLAELFIMLRTAEKYGVKFAIDQIVKETLLRAQANPKKALEIFAMGSSLGIDELITGASKACLSCSPRELFEFEITTQSGQTAVGTNQAGSTEYLLRQISAWDYHRLQNLYRQRSRRAKEIISSAIRHNRDPSSWRGCSCPIDQTGHPKYVLKTFVDKASAEIDNSGPTSMVIFQHQWLADCVKDHCELCCKFFLVNMHLGLYKIKIDALQDHV